MVQTQERAMESAVVGAQEAYFCRACGQPFCDYCRRCNVNGDGLCCTCRYQMEKGVGNE
jgi:hypothetical protein